jgi:hypothetical protein
MHTTIRLAVFSAVLGLAVSARAQPVTPIAQHTEAVTVLPTEPADQLTLSAALGATLNSGNTESYAGNASGRLGLMRYPHQLTIEGLGTLGYTAIGGNDVEQTSANVIGRGRYDLFLSRMDALFVAVQPLRNTFAGIEGRIQSQVGYLRNLYFPADTHRLWGEAGYDFTYDWYGEIATTETVYSGSGEGVTIPGVLATDTVTATRTVTLPKDQRGINSARLFFGYTNLLYAAANLNLGVEALFNLKGSESDDVRINSLAEITSSISEHFKLGVQARILFDNVPVPTKKKTDAIIGVQLVYSYDSLAAKPAPAEAPAPAATP